MVKENPLSLNQSDTNRTNHYLVVCVFPRFGLPKCDHFEFSLLSWIVKRSPAWLWQFGLGLRRFFERLSKQRCFSINKEDILWLCWKLHDTLIVLNLIDIYKWFRLSIHNQTNMYAARVLSPHIWHCSTCLPRDVLCVPLSNKPRVVSGVNRSVVVKIAKSLKWINRDLIMKRGTAFSCFRQLAASHFTAWYEFLFYFEV